MPKLIKNTIMKLKVLSSLAILALVTIFLSSCGDKYSVKTDKSTYTVGEKITVTYTADPNWDSHAWIGLVPSSNPHGKEADSHVQYVDYQYLNNSPAGTVELTPSEAGSYDVRLFDSQDTDTGLEIASVTVTIE